MSLHKSENPAATGLNANKNTRNAIIQTACFLSNTLTATAHIFLSTGLDGLILAGILGANLVWRFT